MTIILMLIKLAAALIGLTLPGYLLARALRLEACLAAAFPLSAFLICQTVMTLAMFDRNIGAVPATAVLILLSALLAIFGRRQTVGPATIEPPATGQDVAPSRLLSGTALTTVILLVLAASFRATLYPLAGFDTFTRWDALARAMLQYGNLSFYPPVTPNDFSIYTMPDGFPPLVASVYWWLYAATGSAAPQLTAIAVILQLASLLGLVYKSANISAGRTAAALSMLVLAASPFMTGAVLIGQESGFMALAVAGQFCFALAASKRPAVAPVVAAALFAALGANAREYGPALALPGFLLLFLDDKTRHLAWKYLLFAALLSSPWYLRNWLVTGTPLYPYPLPGAPPANPLLVSLYHYYGELFGLTRHSTSEWLAAGGEFVTGAAIIIIAGTIYLAAKERRPLPYAVSALLIVVLWLWSVGKTSGGLLYSLRVLTPALVILSLPASSALAQLYRSKWQKPALLILFALSLRGVLCTLAFPFPLAQIGTAILSTKEAAPDFIAPYREFAAQLNRSAITSAAILTDSPNLAVILKRETRFRPVIIWSSEVSALLAAENDARETEKALQQRGIGYIAMNRTSLHNDLLYRLPLYREGTGRWQPVVVNGEWVLFAIAQVAAQ